MSLEELVGTLKVHEQELQQDKGPKREKSLALNSQKNKKVLSSKEHISRNSFKALKFDNSSNEESEENSDKDELPFISWKIRKMWKNKGGSKWKNSWKRVLKEKIEKDKKLYNMLWLQESPTLQIWVYRTKKGSRQEETLQDQREERSYKHQEDLDDTSSDEEEEKTNLCLMVDTTSEEFESDKEDEVTLDDPESLK